MSDLISRQAAIDVMWNALYEYEDKTEKQFQESEDLDVSDWIQHRIFVQNMSDIDRKTILELPSAEPKWIPCDEDLPKEEGWYLVTNDAGGVTTVEMSWYEGYDSPTNPFWELDNPVAWMRCPKPYGG